MCFFFFSYGDGSAILVGSFFGISAQNGSADATRFIQQLVISWASIQAPVTLNCTSATQQVEARLITNYSSHVLIVVNTYGASMEGCTVSIAPQQSAELNGVCHDLKVTYFAICLIPSACVIECTCSSVCVVCCSLCLCGCMVAWGLVCAGTYSYIASFFVCVRISVRV